MKTRLTTILTVSILIFFVYSCNKNPAEKEEQTEVTGKVLSQSDCKSFFKEYNTSNADSNQSCIVYTYDAENKRLSITHENAGFNCCPGEITCAISFSNDTITIEEFEEYAICYCKCLFDLEIEVNGVLAKSYFLKFVEPYVGNQEKLEFTLDLQQHASGEYCVERSKYPWGT